MNGDATAVDERSPGMAAGRDEVPLELGSPRRSPARRIVAVGALLLAAGGAAWIVLREDGPRAAAPVGPAVPTGTATAQRRDLVDRQDIDGTLEFAGVRSVSAAAAGTVTGIAGTGSVARRGRSLLALDGREAAIVLYGSVPMYRDLQRGVRRGDDVLQLQQNLAALGYDPYGALVADGRWSAATTDAVKRWQDARGVRTDGRVPRRDVLFTSGPVRVAGHGAAVGDQVAPGAPVLQVSGTRRVVVGRLAASRQAAVDVGDRVRVALPGGRDAAGVVERVGRIAKPGQDGGDPTVALRVRLRGTRGRAVALDRAPVTISVATSVARNALSVPITALLARGRGHYAVELPGGRLVPVRTGAFADGYVEIRGPLRAGRRVVVPR